MERCFAEPLNVVAKTPEAQAIFIGNLPTHSLVNRQRRATG
jgi:hypothetical protein